MGLDSTLAPAGALVAGGQRHGGEAGDEHDPQARVAGGGLAGHLDAVHAGHDDVGEQQVPVLVEHGGGLLAVGAGGHLIAGAFQRAGQEAAQGVVVFGQEDAGHGLWTAVSDGARCGEARQHNCRSGKGAMNPLTRAGRCGVLWRAMNAWEPIADGPDALGAAPGGRFDLRRAAADGRRRRRPWCSPRRIRAGSIPTT